MQISPGNYNPCRSGLYTGYIVRPANFKFDQRKSTRCLSVSGFLALRARLRGTFPPALSGPARSGEGDHGRTRAGAPRPAGGRPRRSAKREARRPESPPPPDRSTRTTVVAKTRILLPGHLHCPGPTCRAQSSLAGFQLICPKSLWLHRTIRFFRVACRAFPSLYIMTGLRILHAAGPVATQF